MPRVSLRTTRAEPRSSSRDEDGDRLAWDLEDAEFVEAARKHLADWYAHTANLIDASPNRTTVLTQA